MVVQLMIVELVWEVVMIVVSFRRNGGVSGNGICILWFTAKTAANSKYVSA